MTQDPQTITLSPRDLGEAVGVSESSIKRWIDDGRIIATRTAGGHRRVSLAQALEFIRESGMEVQDPRLLGIVDLPDRVRPSSDPETLVREALLRGEARKVRGLLLSEWLQGHSIAELVDGPLQKALAQIGTLWKSEDRGIYLEHRAVDICIGALNQVRDLLPPPDEDAPLAVGGTAPGDPYLLPSLAVACTLATEGWRVSNLGPDTPYPILLRAARDLGAQLAWVSISAPLTDPEDAVEELHRVARELAEEDCLLVAGGRSFPRSLGRGVANLETTRSLAELTAFARGLRRPVS